MEMNVQMNVEGCSTSTKVQRSRAFLIRKSRLGYEDPVVSAIMGI